MTEWGDQLRRVPLYAIISRFVPGHTPGVGTFYDFFHRLWSAPSPHLTGRIRPKRNKRPIKAKKKGEKAPFTTRKKVERLVERILLRRSTISSLPTDRLMSLFQDSFVQVSALLGIRGDMSAPSLSGDGTPYGQGRCRVVSACVTVENMESTRISILVAIRSRTVAPGGTATVNAITLGITCIGLRHPTVPTTCPCIPDWEGRLAMTPCHSW